MEEKSSKSVKAGITKKILKNSDRTDDKLVQKVLDNDDYPGNYFSDKFSKIEEEVKISLGTNNTDTALKSLSIGALYLGSSDIHYDNWEEKVVIRFRIDGVLVDIFELTKKEYKKILERLKYSAEVKLNITDVPQDGKYNFLIGENKIDVRLSTLPTKYGENIVCRLLDGSSVVLNFEDLGFYWMSKRIIERSIKNKMGMILVTGPTGSGKTTTLYTILEKLNTRGKKIMTLEDPVEYDMPGIVQSEINEKKGYNFDTGLRALLRQDPDVIMVGEIRDYETLNTATSAALTGHLVLSTLHTKSAAETLDRIVSMGLPTYILSGALETIVAQRLVRKICSHCKKKVETSKDEEQVIKNMMKNVGMSEFLSNHIQLYRGEGCKKCNNSGFKGRIGIFEIISMDNTLRMMVKKGASPEKIIEIAKGNGMIMMQEDGILKALKGFTTIEEVLRVV